MERASIVLPHPDSPTMPMVSPELTSSETPLTALILPCVVSNAVCKSFISRSGGIVFYRWARLRRNSTSNRTVTPDAPLGI